MREARIGGDGGGALLGVLDIDSDRPAAVRAAGAAALAATLRAACAR